MKAALHSRPWDERFEDAWEGIREAGYGAVESFCASQWFSKPNAFRKRLSDAGLLLAAMECGGEWIVPERAAVEKDAAERLARFLGEVGADVMVASGGRRPLEGAPLESFARLADAMNGLGETCRNQGVTLCFHSKRGTLTEYRDQIALLMEGTDPQCVSLCLDTGELALSGSDPLEVMKAYGSRIGHVHLKDLDWYSHRTVAPGQGSLELDLLLDALRAEEYAGWITVELDDAEDPVAEGRASMAFLNGQEAQDRPGLSVAR